MSGKVVYKKKRGRPKKWGAMSPFYPASKWTPKKYRPGKNEWVYKSGMSKTTKAPTYYNENPRGKYKVKVTSKSRIAYFLTHADWLARRNAVVFKIK